jgi:AraC family transcriptional regulator
MTGEVAGESESGISFLPAPQARRAALVCPGMVAETIAIGDRQPFESRYCGPLHLLIAHERLARRRGATTVEGLPESTLENLSQTLTFVPAGRRFREWHDPDIPSRVTYIHIDPTAAAMRAGSRTPAPALGPRLHFQSAALWQTVLKLRALIDEGRADCGQYGEALGIVLAHELAHASENAVLGPEIVRGGLAVWQRRLVAQHVEDHLEEPLPIATLAELVRLSRYHFCRAFRRSFGVSPHRYHLHRRMERGKALLTDSALSVTEIALELGFQETSSFSTAFRKLVGRAPTAYRRSFAPVL